jgi:hypothetical protein
MIFVLTNHHGKPVVFDEPRYLIPISLFLYAYFFAGLKAIFERLTRREAGGRLVYLVAAVLLVFLLWRNQQQAAAVFPVADLSTGSAWAQTHTDQDAVFMTPDPENRYLYLQRHTVAYPDDGRKVEITQELDKWAVTHMLVAPPLRIDGSANVEQLTDQNIHSTVEQLTQAYPDCLSVVFEDAEAKTMIYKVDRQCIHQ